MVHWNCVDTISERWQVIMGCIAEIVYGTVECNGDCEHCHWWDEPRKSEKYAEKADNAESEE